MKKIFNYLLKKWFTREGSVLEKSNKSNQINITSSLDKWWLSNKKTYNDEGLCIDESEDNSIKITPTTSVKYNNRADRDIYGPKGEMGTSGTSGISASGSSGSSGEGSPGTSGTSGVKGEMGHISMPYLGFNVRIPVPGVVNIGSFNDITIQDIPENLFDNIENVTNFVTAFSGCTYLHDSASSSTYSHTGTTTGVGWGDSEWGTSGKMQEKYGTRGAGVPLNNNDGRMYSDIDPYGEENWNQN